MFAVAADGRLNVNVALNRPAYQVSTHTYLGMSLYANLANDGNNNTNAWQGFCAVTELVTNAWWAVDLLTALYVVGIKFTNRGEDIVFGTSTALYRRGGQKHKYVCQICSKFRVPKIKISIFTKLFKA